MWVYSYMDLRRLHFSPSMVKDAGWGAKPLPKKKLGLGRDATPRLKAGMAGRALFVALAAPLLLCNAWQAPLLAGRAPLLRQAGSCELTLRHTTPKTCLQCRAGMHIPGIGPRALRIAVSNGRDPGIEGYSAARAAFLDERPKRSSTPKKRVLRTIDSPPGLVSS